MARNNRNRNNGHRRQQGGPQPGYTPTPTETVGADRDKPFTFTDRDGKLWKLPPASSGSDNVEAGSVIDAVVGDERLAAVRLAWATLEACEADPAAVTALRRLPMRKFMPLIETWMRRTGGGGPGESSG